MTVRITQFENPDRGAMRLQVAGKLLLADAEILEQEFDNLHRTKSRLIKIDLSEISFLDSDGAAVLLRLRKRGADLTGISFFVRKVLETAESGVDGNS